MVSINLTDKGRNNLKEGSHRIKLKTDSPSMIDRDEILQYDLIKRLLSINKITVPNIHTCVSYFITRMESPSIYHLVIVAFNALLQLLNKRN